VSHGTRRLSELVLFEIPVDADVDRFRARLQPRWTGWPRLDHDAWLVAAEATNVDGLAALLGEVQAILPELGLRSIRYCRDTSIFELPGVAAA
jgi:hypothetical protein